MGLNEEERQLISGFLKGNEEATRNFQEKFKRKIYSITLKISRNSDDADEWTQDIFLKLFHELQKPNKLSEIRSLEKWVLKVAKNLCIDRYRKTKYERQNKIEVIDSDFEDEDESSQIKEQFFEQNQSFIEKLKEKDSEKFQGLESSLDYVYRLFKLKKELMSDKTNLLSLIKLVKRLKGLKVPKELSENPALKIDFNPLQKELDKRINRLEAQLNSIPIFKEFAPFYCEIDNFFENILEMKIDPAKLIFKVIHKVLRKGEYTNLSLIKKILLEFKRKFEGTEKEFLFNSIRDSMNIDTLRKKAVYREKGLKDFYDKLTVFILKKCFSEGKKLSNWAGNKKKKKAHRKKQGYQKGPKEIVPLLASKLNKKYEPIITMTQEEFDSNVETKLMPSIIRILNKATKDKRVKKIGMEEVAREDKKTGEAVHFHYITIMVEKA